MNCKNEHTKLEIILFTEGDAANLATWSCVPWFLATTLEKRGCTVHRVNLDCPILVRYGFNFLVRIGKFFLRHRSRFCWNQTPLFYWLVRRKMKRAFTMYPMAQGSITTRYSYTPKSVAQLPSILLSDWTLAYWLKHYERRAPDWLEKREISRQASAMQAADTVISIFPNTAEDLSQQCGRPVLYWGHPVNALPWVLTPQNIAKKLEKKCILFVGREQYLAGLCALVAAFRRLKKKFPTLELHVVGMTAFQAGIQMTEGMHFYGYLNRTDKKERAQYENLMQHASVLVNTTPHWSGFSAALEGLYHGTPVLTYNAEIFEKVTENATSFCFECRNDVDGIVQTLYTIFSMNDDSYTKISNAAHDAAKKCDWDNYAEKIISHFKKGQISN